MNLITFDRVSKTFSKRFQPKTTILENISFSIQKGEFVIKIILVISTQKTA